MADKTTAEKTATGVKPIPEGYHTVTSYLTIRDAKKAMEFYEKAFGATNRGALVGPDGKVMHGEIKIGDTVIMICDEIPQFGHLGPQSRGGNTSSLLIYTDKVDEDFDRAVKAGCTVKQPLENRFWGDRWGLVEDPFGHSWAFAMHVEDVSPEEMQKRAPAGCS